MLKFKLIACNVLLYNFGCRTADQFARKFEGAFEKLAFGRRRFVEEVHHLLSCPCMRADVGVCKRLLTRATC